MLQFWTNLIADALSGVPVFPPSETDSENFVDVCHAVSTLQKDPDPILAPMIEAAKSDTDYQMYVQALVSSKILNHYHSLIQVVNLTAFGLG